MALGIERITWAYASIWKAQMSEDDLSESVFFGAERDENRLMYCDSIAVLLFRLPWTPCLHPITTSMPQ